MNKKQALKEIQDLRDGKPLTTNPHKLLLTLYDIYEEECLNEKLAEMGSNPVDDHTTMYDPVM